MVRRLLIVVIVVASSGCLKSHPLQCAVDSDCGAAGACEANGYCSFVDSKCESGRRFGELSGPVAGTCVSTTTIDIDAGVDMMMGCANDGDCDTVIDTDDNCPQLSNLDQYDEDGDDIGDACDLCPAYMDSGADADGDKVGDLCDPNPSMSGDSFVEFVNFQSMPTGWMANNFTTMSGDAVATTGSTVIGTLLRDAPTGDHYTISASATLTSIAGTSLGAIGVVASHQPGSDAQLLCQNVGMSDGTQHELRLFDTNVGPPLLLDSGARAFNAGARFEIELHRDGTAYDCDATNPAAQLSGTSSFSPGSPQVGLRVRSVTARYHWVMIVASP